MNEQQQRMAAVGTDKELSDLLDFSAVREWGEQSGWFWVALGGRAKRVRYSSGGYRQRRAGGLNKRSGERGEKGGK